MRYREHQPLPELRDVIRCIWTLEGNETFPEPERIFPDGCMELVFHYGDPFTRIAGTRASKQGRLILVGQIKNALMLQSGRHIGIVGVRFHPWGAWPFLRLPLHELLEKDLDLDLVFGNEAKQLCDELMNRTAEQAPLVLQHFLLKKLGENLPAKKGIQGAVKAIYHCAGSLAVEKLAADSNLSLRQFNRSFVNQVGLSPKVFSRITRFRHFFSIAREHPGQSLTSLALQCGYYDQAHFIREFREHTGMNPGEFLKSGSEMTGLFLG